MKKKIFVSLLAATLLSPVIMHPIAKASIEKKVVFSDVTSKNGSELSHALSELTKSNVVKGYGDNTFRPNNSVTRGQVAAMIDRALHLEPKVKKKTFSDVKSNHSFYHQINRVQQAGVIDGYEDGTFRPQEPLTRSQMAKIISLAFNLPKGKDSNFPDVKKGNWSEPYINAIASQNITLGMSGLFKPSEEVTRGQYALFTYRSLLWAKTNNQEILKEELQPDPIEKPKEERFQYLVIDETGYKDKTYVKTNEKVIRRAIDKHFNDLKKSGMNIEKFLEKYPVTFHMRALKEIPNGGLYWRQSDKIEIGISNKGTAGVDYMDGLIIHEFGHHVGYKAGHVNNVFDEFSNYKDLTKVVKGTNRDEWKNNNREKFAEAYKEAFAPFEITNRTATGNWKSQNEKESFVKWIISKMNISIQ